MDVKFENTNGRTVAVLADKGNVRKWLSSQLLLPSKYFIIELLHELAQAEKKLREDYGSQDLYVYVTPFLERITIESNSPGGTVEVQQIEIQLDIVKLLLLEWGIILHRQYIEQKK